MNKTRNDNNDSNDKTDPNISEDEQQNYSCYSWYGGELIANRKSRYTKDEQMKILDTHPFFTGLCPKCEYKFNEENSVASYKCPICGRDE